MACLYNFLIRHKEFLPRLHMVSHVDIVDGVELPKILSPVARGGGRRGRIGQ